MLLEWRDRKNKYNLYCYIGCCFLHRCICGVDQLPPGGSGSCSPPDASGPEGARVSPVSHALPQGGLVCQPGPSTALRGRHTQRHQGIGHCMGVVVIVWG